MAGLKWIFIVAAAAYVGLAALMYLRAARADVLPRTLRTAPAAAGFPQAQEVMLDTADGERVHRVACAAA